MARVLDLVRDLERLPAERRIKRLENENRALRADVKDLERRVAAIAQGMTQSGERLRSFGEHARYEDGR